MSQRRTDNANRTAQARRGRTHITLPTEAFTYLRPTSHKNRQRGLAPTRCTTSDLKKYPIKGGDTVEEFPPPSPQTCPGKKTPGGAGTQTCPGTVRARFENMQPSRSAPSFSFASGSPRRPFRFTDVRLAKYQPLIERTQCMHHGNHGRPPR